MFLKKQKQKKHIWQAVNDKPRTRLKKESAHAALGGDEVVKGADKVKEVNGVNLSLDWMVSVLRLIIWTSAGRLLVKNVDSRRKNNKFTAHRSDPAADDRVRDTRVHRYSYSALFGPKWASDMRHHLLWSKRVFKQIC